MQIDIHGKAGPQDIRAQIFRLIGFGQGPLDDLGGQCEFTANVNVGGSHADRIGGQDHSLDHLVRVSFHELAILERARFALIGVAT